MTDSDDFDELFDQLYFRVLCVCLALLFGFGSCVGFLDSTLNTHRKKLLLDQFAAEGSDVTATRIDHEAGTNFDRVYYSYRDEHGREYQKEYDVVLKTCAREPSYHRFFTVKVLNGYPKSGLPEVFVDSRSRDYGICNIVIGGLFCSMCIGGCPAFFLVCVVRRLVVRFTSLGSFIERNSCPFCNTCGHEQI